MDTAATLSGAAVAIVAVIGATLAVSLGHIDSSTYSAIVGTAIGGGIGVGAHAAGVNQRKP